MHPERHETPHQISLGWLLIPALGLILAVALLQPPPGDSSGVSSPAVGQPAPGLDLIPLTADPSKLAPPEPAMAGQVTLLHFWGTWCGPCRMEYPELSALENRLRRRPGFRFLSVSCESGRGETFAALRSKTLDYFASAGLDSFAFADPRGNTRRGVATLLGHDSMLYPTSLVIGVDGKVAGVWEGYAVESIGQMEQLIARLLETSGEPT
jgi:thiol-disulfide isomerase/thioredoxin